MDSLKKIKRFSKIVKVVSKYGFEEILSRGNDLFHSDHNTEFFNQSFNQRFRMALEELGPTYIKFGQLLSNRKDLVPESLVEELKKLFINQLTLKILNQHVLEKILIVLLLPLVQQ